MLVKIHHGTRMVVAICDSDLIGKKFEEGKKQLDMRGGFFEGEEKNAEEVREIVENAKKEDASFNVVGEEACRVCQECDLFKGDEFMMVEGVPVGLVLL